MGRQMHKPRLKNIKNEEENYRRSSKNILRTAALLAIISIPLSACSDSIWQKERISTKTEICQLMSAEEMGENLPSQIEKYSYSHRDSHFYCSVVLERQRELETDFSRLLINYKERKQTDVITEFTSFATYDDLLADPEVKLFAIEGVDGEGLTSVIRGHSVAAWKYPDEHVLSLDLGPSARADDMPDRTQDTKALLQKIVTKIPQITESPSQQFTTFPDE